MTKERDRLEQLVHRAGLSKETLNALRFALHGQASHSTVKSREDAFKLLNVDLTQHKKWTWTRR